ncbi:MAG: PKD domain-containing protein [Chitinophagaceae bacterium]|nr:MAG: PKD domain-containing protein [Chitinophagaceae bacterium]
MKCIQKSECKKSFKSFSVFAVLSILAIFSLTQCTKDPVRGWTYFTESPSPPEIVSLTSVIKNCSPPYPVTFFQQTENLLGNVNYLWDFGDGTTSIEQNPTHIYQTPGDYTITLVISNEVGADTAVLEVPELSQTSIPVEAGFAYTHFNNNNFAPNKIEFSNFSSGANIFAWDFGDGSQDNDDDPVHIFQNSGQYTVKLKGTCTDGTYDEVTQQIFISPAPQRIFIDSINLMLPSQYRNRLIYIEVYHNTTFVGATNARTPSSYPVKFRASQHFPGGYFFDFVNYGQNEVFKFVILRERTDEPPEFLYEITLSPYAIQNNFYPKAYFQIEHVPVLKDVFIDLYMSY